MLTLARAQAQPAGARGAAAARAGAAPADWLSCWHTVPACSPAHAARRGTQEEPEARPSAPVAPPQAPSNASKLTIFLQTADGKRTKFKLKSDTRFASVFTAYCESTGRPRSSVAFSFDGDAVQPDATPGDLDMGDEDVVDVKLT
jgi:hypothetical protein